MDPISTAVIIGLATLSFLLGVWFSYRTDGPGGGDDTKWWHNTNNKWW